MCFGGFTIRKTNGTRHSNRMTPAEMMSTYASVVACTLMLRETMEYAVSVA